MQTQTIYRRQKNIVSRAIAGETILVPIRGELADMEKIFSLQEVGEFIWQHLDGKLSLQEVCDRITDTFDVDSATAAQDLQGFLAELLSAGLVVEAA